MIFSDYIHKANAEYRRIRKRVPLGVLHSEEEYKNAVAVLDEIIDEIGQNENHPLAEMAETLALFIHSYEEAHFSPSRIIRAGNPQKSDGGASAQAVRPA